MSDVRATLTSLGRASELPISVVCVGVGDGPFGLMQDLDDLPTEKRRFDNFQVKEIENSRIKSKLFQTFS